MSNIGNKEIFSKNLLYYIEKRGKTQIEIAEALGVSRSTFNEWVKGKKYPRIDKIEKLANYFRIKKSDLIEDKKTFSPPDENITEEEEELLVLFRRIPKASQPLARLLLDSVSQLPEERQQMALDMVRIALKK